MGLRGLKSGVNIVGAAYYFFGGRINVYAGDFVVAQGGLDRAGVVELLI